MVAVWPVRSHLTPRQDMMPIPYLRTLVLLPSFLHANLPIRLGWPFGVGSVGCGDSSDCRRADGMELGLVGDWRSRRHHHQKWVAVHCSAVPPRQSAHAYGRSEHEAMGGLDLPTSNAPAGRASTQHGGMRIPSYLAIHPYLLCSAISPMADGQCILHIKVKVRRAEIQPLYGHRTLLDKLIGLRARASVRYSWSCNLGVPFRRERWWMELGVERALSTDT